MTTRNGAAIVRLEDLDKQYHYGVEVLRLHVGDPIPSPRAPHRYAVHVSPDLARYFLSFNHPKNRKPKPSAIARYSRDMAQGFWAFTPESVIFSLAGVLEDGQNRLRAIEQSGATVWLMLDFGWPSDLIEKINRGSARTNADAFTVNGQINATVVSSGMSLADRYLLTAGTPSLWPGNKLLTASEALEKYRADQAAWDEAALWGRRAYDKVMGLGPTTWCVAFYVIARAAGSASAVAFFSQLVDDTGSAGSATRKLMSHYTRRKLKDTASGDKREPLENIVRAYNAWRANKTPGFVRTGGAFVLSVVKE